jgi:hypothetical protein
MTPPDPAWERLGQMLFQRRTQLDARYSNRSKFATERGVDYRVVYDIEKARRTNFGDAVLGAIERAYELPAGAIRAALKGDDFPEPHAAATLSATTTLTTGPTPVTLTDSGRGMDISTLLDQLSERDEEFETELVSIAARIAAVAAQRGIEIKHVAGADVFGEGSDLARVWDAKTRRTEARLALMADISLTARRRKRLDSSGSDAGSERVTRP